MRAAASVLVLAMGLAALPSLLAAQELELRGRVVDAATGAGVDGAEVGVAGPSSGSVVTGARGEWRVARLAPGLYRVTVRRIGFAAKTVEVAAPFTGELSLGVRAEALPLDALVVTASRRSQRLADVPVTTELISRSDLERAGAADLSAVLVEHTGIQLEGGHPNGESVMLQGMTSQRVLVLLDGQPLEGRISGQVDLSRIPVSLVERVEVVKGPQSSLYGSEAMGGVVNIVTRGAAAEPWALDVDLTAGSQGRAEGSATLAGTRSGIGYTLGGGRRRAALTPGQSEEPGALADRWDGMAKLAWSARESLRLEGGALVTDERQRWRSGTVYQFADNRETSAQLGLVWTAGPSRLSPLIHWTQFDHLARGAAQPRPIEGTGQEESQRQVEAELIYNRAGKTLALDLGVEAKQEYTQSDRVLDRERSLYSIEPFAQATWTRGRLSLVPGARLSWSEQWGSHLSPRLAALFRPTPALALRAAVGQGFRAPAFKELYITFLNIGPGYAYTVRGNPELRPERSTNVTAGLEWSTTRGYVRAQVYHNDFDRFIESAFLGDSAGVTVYSYGNVVDGFTRGAELEAVGAMGPVRVEASYAYLEARESATDLPLLERPAHSARGTLDYALPIGLRLALTGLYTGSTPIQRTEEETVVRSNFLRFDARLSQRLPRGIEASLGARNVLNDAPQYWPGFSGRQLYLAVGWNAAASAN